MSNTLREEGSGSKRGGGGVGRGVGVGGGSLVLFLWKKQEDNSKESATITQHLVIL